MQDSGVEVCLSLHVPYVPDSIRTRHFVVLVIFFYCYSVLYFFFSLFTSMANISIFLSH